MEEGMQIAKHIDLYTGMHKGQRLALYRLAMRAGALDHTDERAVAALRADLADLREEFYLHAEHEERELHPILRSTAPALAEDIEADHRNMNRMFDELVQGLDGLIASNAPPEVREGLSLDCYKATNRFIGFYIAHTEKEEGRVQPAIWAATTADESFEAFTRVMRSQAPKEAAMNLSILFPAVSPGEFIRLSRSVGRILSPESMESAREIAARTLEPHVWEKVKGPAGFAEAPAPPEER